LGLCVCHACAVWVPLISSIDGPLFAKAINARIYLLPPCRPRHATPFHPFTHTHTRTNRRRTGRRYTHITHRPQTPPGQPATPLSLSLSLSPRSFPYLYPSIHPSGQQWLRAGSRIACREYPEWDKNKLEMWAGAGVWLCGCHVSLSPSFPVPFSVCVFGGAAEVSSRDARPHSRQANRERGEREKLGAS